MTRAVEISVGSLSPTINWTTLRLEEFDLPPLAQQRRIAEMLWAVDDVSSAWIETLTKLHASMDNYRTSVLTRTHDLTKRARISTIAEVAEIIMGQSPAGHTYNSEGNGRPLLNGPTEFGETYPKEVQYTTSPTKFCEPNDILFCVRGSTTGRQNIADKEYCIGRGLAAIRGKSDLSVTEYLKVVLEALAEDIFREAKGSGSTFPNITSERLGAQQLPLPSVTTQKEIGQYFASMKGLEKVIQHHITQTHWILKALPIS